MRARFAVVVLLALCGCATWRPQGLTPEAVLRLDHPERIRLTLTDSTRLVLWHPILLGDSISGLRSGKTRTVPLTDVPYVSLRRPDNGATFGGLGLLLTAGLVGLVAATWNE